MPEDFHRHLAVVLQILGQVDRRHPTATEFALDGVAAGEGGFEAVEGIRHGTALRLAAPLRRRVRDQVASELG